MRRAHHGDVVTQFGGVLGKPQSLDGRLNAGARDQDFFVGRSFARAPQHLAPLVVAQQDGLAGRALHNNAGDRPARILLDVLFQLAKVDLAVRIKRRGDGRIDSGKKHDGYQQSVASCHCYFTRCAAEIAHGLNGTPGDARRPLPPTWEARSLLQGLGTQSRTLR